MSTENQQHGKKMFFTEKLEIPQGVQVTVDNMTVGVKGKNGEVKRTLIATQLKMVVEGTTMTFTTQGMSKKEKRGLFTAMAHVKNMLKGASEGHMYRLKICSGHFPMTVSVTGTELVVKNFLGEKYPRKLLLHKEAKVKVDGDSIVIESADKEIAGRIAAQIEHLTDARGKDRRIFQDGIYAIVKDGKDIK